MCYKRRKFYPDEYGSGLHLNINETSNDLDIAVAMEAARYFKLKPETANKIIKEMQQSISKWRVLAKKTGISDEEIERVSAAFH